LARSEKYESTCIKGVLPFVAPEVFTTGKFTQKSDGYAFRIIMYLLASGEPPFRNRQFDNSLVHDSSNGLLPWMPYSAPTVCKYIAMLCCDANLPIVQIFFLFVIILDGIYRTLINLFGIPSIITT